MSNRQVSRLDSSQLVVTEQQLPSAGRQKQQEPSRKPDQWTDNIHLKRYHENSEIATQLATNNILTTKDDKFIDFI